MTIILRVVFYMVVALNLYAAEPPKLDEPLEAFRPLLEKTWRGEFKNSKPEKPLVDVVRWERALNGKAIRVSHSINDGAYGGESIIRWDEAKKQLVYHYFTTAGFYTTGTMKFLDGKITAVEQVLGRTNGITEVRSTYELKKDGTLLAKSEYLKDGEPSGNREVVYRVAPEAKVRFK